jgi:hypothetical protein
MRFVDDNSHYDEEECDRYGSSGSYDGDSDDGWNGGLVELIVVKDHESRRVNISASGDCDYACLSFYLYNRVVVIMMKVGRQEGI